MGRIIHNCLGFVLLIALFQSISQAAEQRRTLHGSQASNRTLLRLTPGITKSSSRYINRTGGVMNFLGGSDETEDAVRLGLGWLARQQKKDGRWEETKGPIAHTGLAMLCYYSYGASHAKEGPYQTTLTKALEWMIGQVGPKGQLMGNGRMYDQAIGTLALAEAYGITKDEKIKRALLPAMEYLINSQNPKTGGWRYVPYQVKADNGDLSVSGWAVMALASAQISGITVPMSCRAKALEFLDRVGTGTKRGMYGYTTPAPRPSMTAEGMYTYELLVGTKKSDRLDESVKYLLTHLPDKTQENFYFWYYGTLALRLYGGTAWEAWNSRMTPILLDLQHPDGYWSPMGKRAAKEGRIVTTTWAILSLEVYYRYSPLGQVPRRTIRGDSIDSVEGSGKAISSFSRASTRPNSGRPQ